MSDAADKPEPASLRDLAKEKPRKPANVDPLAERVLGELARSPASAEIVLGGYFALRHYADYRQTHDIDAWWRGRASPDVENSIRDVMQRIAVEEGSLYGERRFGETISFELAREGRKHFSFQIAVRSIELAPPLPSAWPPIQIETLADNIGAKMNALVERGSPRDFTDIRQVVAASLATVDACWELWQRKNPGRTIVDAKRTALQHFTALERRRPLESIEDESARRRAVETRDWVRRELLRHS